MALRTDEKVVACGWGTEYIVETRDLGIGFVEASAIEKVIGLAKKQYRVGGAGDQEVGDFKAGADHAGRVLLAISGQFVFEVGHKSGDEARGGCHGDPLFDWPEPSGHRAATRVAG